MLAAYVTGDALDEILADIPDAWLEPDPKRPDRAAPADPAAARAAYSEYLLARLEQAPSWLPDDQRDRS